MAQPRRGTENDVTVIAGGAVQGPPGKVSVRQGLLKEDSVLQKRSFSARPPAPRAAARAGCQAQQGHRPGHGRAAEEQHSPCSTLWGATACSSLCGWMWKGICGGAAKTGTYEDRKVPLTSRRI